MCINNLQAVKTEEVGHGPDCIMGQILNFAHLTETVAP